MTMETVQILGMSAIDAVLAELPQGLRGKALQIGLMRAAQPLVTTIRSRIPRGKDPRRRGGAAFRREGRSAKIGPLASSVRARPLRSRVPSSVVIAVGPDQPHFYLRFLDRGTFAGRGRRVVVGFRASTSEKKIGMTVIRPVKAVTVGRQRIKAQNILRPAFDASVRQVLDNAALEISASMRAFVEKLRVRAETGKLSKWAQRQLAA